MADFQGLGNKVRELLKEWTLDGFLSRIIVALQKCS